MAPGKGTKRNRKRMYKSNRKIVLALRSLGFTNIYLFPHLRFLKDYYLDTQGFDCIAWKVFSDSKKECCLFQFKTNKKAPKSVISDYVEIEKIYSCKCFWANCEGKIVTITRAEDRIVVMGISKFKTIKILECESPATRTKETIPTPL